MTPSHFHFPFYLHPSWVFMLRALLNKFTAFKSLLQTLFPRDPSLKHFRIPFLEQWLATPRLPLALGPPRDWFAVFSIISSCSSLSTARKTPHCISTSPPRVPRSTMSSTSTRYEPQCERVLRSARRSPILRTKYAAETN